jgi:Ferritin-like
MPQTETRIRWHRPSQLPEASFMTSAGAPAALTEREAMRRLVLRVGVPVVEGAASAKEYAIGLLKLAAEVEHALLVQYLYAAFSLPNETAPDSVNYHLRLMVIAIQEMGHLMTVQNLLLLLGGRDGFYMQRDLIRENSEKNPIPYVLEPISKASLAKYVAAEKPAQVPLEIKEKVDELVALAEHDSGVETHRVGVLYELLKWIFKSPDDAEPIDFSSLAPLPAKPHITDADLQENLLVAPKFEALREEWGVHVEDVILEPVHTVAEVRDVLDGIARQGEGLTNGGPSHFTEFMAIVAAFEAGIISVKSMPKAPSLINEGAGLISHPYTRLWAEVFNSQYNLLVLAIYHALVTPRPDDESQGLRSALAKTSIRSMRRVIHPLADLISSLPLRADGGPDKAGPSFALEASILNSNNDVALVAQHIRMLDGLKSLYSAIESSPDFPSFPNHANTIANLRNADQALRNLFPAPI